MNPSSLRASDDEKLVEKWVHQWGYAASEAIFDLDCKFFFSPDIKGLIAYRIKLGCAVVFGDPICSVEEKPLLAEAFQRYCEERNLNIIYIIASEQFAKWAIAHLCKVMIEVGEELIFNPQRNPLEETNGKKKLRNKVSHARGLGLRVSEYLGHDTDLECSIQQVGVKWLQGRKGAQIYIGNLNFFDYKTDRRWFYVKEGEQVIGMALLCKLEAKQGWLIKFLLTVPEAPRGTSELLMTTILDTLHHEDCHFLTYGIVPAERLGEIIGLGKVSSWLCRIFFNSVKWIFNLEQRKIYWRQFLPEEERSYVLFAKPHVGIKEIQALMKSLRIDL